MSGPHPTHSLNDSVYNIWLGSACLTFCSVYVLAGLRRIERIRILSEIKVNTDKMHSFSRWLCAVLFLNNLRSCYYIFTSGLSVSSSAVRHQHGSKVDLQSVVVGPRDASLDGTALVKCSRSSQLQGRHTGLPLSTRPCSTISVGVTTSRCGRGIVMSTQIIRWHRHSSNTVVQAGYCWRSFVSGCRATNMEQSTGNSALSIVAAVV